MKDILEKIRSTKILGIIGNVLIILGTILPYAKYESYFYYYRVNLQNYWYGRVALALAILNLLYLLKNYIEKYIPQIFNSGFGKKVLGINNAKFLFIPIAIIILLMIRVHAIWGDWDIHFNIGFYLLILGIVCTIVYALIYKNDNAQQLNNSNTAMNQPQANSYNTGANQQPMNGYNTQMNQPQVNNYNTGANQPQANNYNMGANQPQANNYNMGTNQQQANSYNTGVDQTNINNESNMNNNANNQNYNG